MRYYEPEAGRFVNQDPIGLLGEENLYSFDEFNKYTDGMEDFDSHCPAFADFGVSFIDSDFLWHSRQMMEKSCQLKC